jgi:hypothetical protein
MWPALLTGPRRPAHWPLIELKPRANLFDLNHNQNVTA